MSSVECAFKLVQCCQKKTAVWGVEELRLHVWSARSERLEIGSGAPTQQPDGAGGFGILGQEKTNMIR
ncbi:hypothetical protein GX50_05109 [[Emmonsia] crescens]|uniref:Uncharacterized protein n=1 Tax=[Emmonsia] crescens TaxID=73230 RepID=A0A2B7ZFY1_9EURO|nr:hypothetical protein GX50_05109 [Emmonsia crescens]